MMNDRGAFRVVRDVAEFKRRPSRDILQRNFSGKMLK